MYYFNYLQAVILMKIPCKFYVVRGERGKMLLINCYTKFKNTYPFLSVYTVQRPRTEITHVHDSHTDLHKVQTFPDNFDGVPTIKNINSRN